MEIRRFNGQSSREPSKQKKLVMTAESWRKGEHVPDLTDFMNDMFFGTVKSDADQKKSYNLTGADQAALMDHEDEELDRECSSRRSTSSRMTEDWLEEARRVVASSPSRCDSPSRLVGSPRFAAAAQGTPSSASLLDRRDPLSRSARRHRAVESFSGEIISKFSHSRHKSETFTGRDSPDSSPSDLSSESAVHRWFSNILKFPNPDKPTPPPPAQQLPPSNPTLSRRQSLPRKSRFQADPSSPRPQAIPAPTGRNSHGPNLLTDPHLLSPPKNLVESAHRRSIRSSTCSAEKPAPRPSPNGASSSDLGVNDFLRAQRTKLRKLCYGDSDAKAKIVLSGTSNSTSSMAAAICYAWLLENRARKEGEEESLILPVMNVKRQKMWKLRQASWLFHHAGLDAASLLFSDEVDLEGLMMTRKLNTLVIGQDVLRINGEVGSHCTILTDNYCEDAYDLLQTPVLKKLLLAGILLDTQNLNSSSQLSMTRDAEAVQLLLVGSTPNYRNTLFDQLMQDQRDNSFLEALRENYGKPPNRSGHESEEHAERRISEGKSPSIRTPEAIIQNSDKRVNSKTSRVSPNSAKPSSPLPQGSSAPQTKTTPDASRGKNKFFLAKWFGFGPK